MKDVILGFHIWASENSGTLKSYPEYDKSIARAMTAALEGHFYVGYSELKKPLIVKMTTRRVRSTQTKYQLATDKT